MNKYAALWLGVALMVTTSCVRRVESRSVVIEANELRQEETMRAAVNLPASFAVVTQPATPDDCPPTLRDDALRTTLTLRRSLVIPVQDSTGSAYLPYGDYAVSPVGQYGEVAGEGVRVDCGRLRGIGIVTLVVRTP